MGATWMELVDDAFIRELDREALPLSMYADQIYVTYLRRVAPKSMAVQESMVLMSGAVTVNVPMALCM